MPTLNKQVEEIIENIDGYDKKLKKFVRKIIQHELDFSDTSHTYKNDYKKYMEEIIKD